MVAEDELGYDPASTEALRRFKAIKQATECVFAPSAIMWGCPEWDPQLDLEANFDRWLPTLLVFSRVSEVCELEGLVLELPGSYGDTPDRLARTTLRALRYISANDPSSQDCMTAEIEDPKWWFTFDGEKLFILTFGPCYPPSSSRYGFETNLTYIVFQPIHCFSRRIPDGAVRKSRQARNQIRHRYKAAGRPYDLAITLSAFEAHRYVKPAELGEPPVRWWQA